MDKCCGTCKWWSITRTDSEYGLLGMCSAPAPDVFMGCYRPQMYVSEGATCPTYQPKEAEREQT